MAHCFPGSTGSTVEGSPPEDVVVTAADDCLSVAGDVPFVGTSPVVFVGDAAMSVVSPAIAGGASPAVFAREVAVDAASFGRCWDGQCWSGCPSGCWE